MEIIRPSYYKDFRCLAGACPDSCCQLWEVEIDPETAALYRSLPGPLGEDLRRVLREEEGDCRLENCGDRCPMWREDGLCRIQAALGEEALSRVCREFPRLRQDYGDLLELGLEMSCPEAARLILSSDDWTLEHQTVPGGEEADYDTDCMAILRQYRPAAFRLLRDRQYSVPQRLTLLLLYGYHVQALLDGAEPTDFDPAAALEEAGGFAAAEPDAASLFDFYRALERLTPDWDRLLTAGPQPPRWEEALCRFAQYGVYRYFYQAVSDYDLVGRIKMLVAGCILTAHMHRDSIPLLQLYTKEIENDADNIDALLDGAYTAPALRDADLLGILMK